MGAYRNFCSFERLEDLRANTLEARGQVVFSELNKIYFRWKRVPTGEEKSIAEPILQKKLRFME